MKKSIATLFTILVLCVLFCIAAPKADAATVASGSCGNNLTWTLDDKGTLTVSGTGSMANWVDSSAPWSSWCSDIVHVTIGNGVTSVGDYAFAHCTKLSSLTIGSGVTTIGNFAFHGADYLKTVTIPDSVTTIGNNAFWDCACLATVTIPDSVITIGRHAFDSCPKLTNLTIGKSVKTIDDYAFQGCTNLRLVRIPDSVITVGAGSFNECNSLVTLYIGNSVKTIGIYAFSECTSLTSVIIPDSVITIGSSAFEKCYTLSSLTIGNSVKTIDGWAFASCIGLTSVVIPDSVTTIDAYAFNNCAGMTSLTIGKSVKTIEDCAFLDCTSLTSVIIPDSVTTICWDAFKNCTDLVSVTIGNGVTSVEHGEFANCTSLQTVTIGSSLSDISASMFYNCVNLTSVTIPDSVRSIGSTAFYGCVSLQTVHIGNGVTTIGDTAFRDCTALSEVTIPNSVATIECYAFMDCAGLTSVTIGNGVTSIGEWAFSDCEGLRLLTIGSGVTTIGTGAFFGCKNMAQLRFAAVNLEAPLWSNDAFYGCGYAGDGIRLIIEAGVSHIPAGMFSATDYFADAAKIASLEFENGSICTSIGEGAFADCAALTTAKLPYSMMVIKPSLFKGCTALKDVELSEKTTIIGISAFEGCVSLVDITIPQKVTHIEKNAFKGCTGLTFVELPAGITSVGGGSFTDCANLKEITFIGPAPKIWTAFTGVTATVYYPASEAGWTKEMLQNYGGTITWVPYGMVEKFDIDVARMILGNALEFQFGVDMTKIPDLTGVYAVVEKSWADRSVTKTVIPASQWGVAGKYYAIVYDGLAAKEMADSFNVTIYNANNEAISNPKTDSVRDYVKRAFDSQTVKGKTMLVDMLNYGAAAQQNFKYNIDDLANNQLTAEQKAYGTKTAAPTTNNLVKDINYKGTRLVLESRIQMQVAFTGLDRTMYAQYTYRDHNDKIQIVTVAGSEFIEVSGLYGIELSKLVYADARQIVTVQIYNSRGALLSTVQDSIESYVNRSGATDPLFDALMKFTDSAKAYLHQ